jgi:hypothetical protein
MAARRFGLGGAAVGSAVLLVLLGFALGRATRGGVPAAAPAPELAAYMAGAQHHTHKLGLAIQAENALLARFYLHELEEVFEQVQELFPEHGGHAVAELSQLVSARRLPKLRERIESEDWDDAAGEFSGLIEACNGCHAVTEHAFIEIQVTNANPFNQAFEK